MKDLLTILYWILKVNNAKTATVQSHLWFVLGPVLIISAFIIVALHSLSMPLNLSVAALAGLICTYQWHWKGVLMACCLLAGALAYSLYIAPKGDWLWLSTLTSCMIASYVVAALSSEESRYAWEVLSKEAQERNDNLSQLQLAVDNAVNETESQKHTFDSRLVALQTEQKAYEDKIASSEKLLHIVRDELNKSHSHQQTLTKELLEARQKIKTLESQKTEAPNKDLQAESIEPLQRIIAARDHEIEGLKTSIQALISEDKQIRHQLEKAENELLTLRKEQEQEGLHSSQRDQERIRQQTIIQELTGHIDSLSKEKNLLESALIQLQTELETIKSTPIEETNPIDERELRRVEGLYNQLRVQFAEKSSLLDATRRELFVSQEMHAKVQKELEEFTINHERDLERHLTKMMQAVDAELSLVEYQQKEIEQLQELITTLM